MAKVNLDDVASGYNRQRINQNFEDIETELNDKVLYRDNPTGEPNQMENDLDMNSNDILNAGDIQAESIVIDGKEVIDPILQGTAEGTSYDDTSSNFVGTNVQDALDSGGTAVSLDAQTSLTDTTADRLMKVGAFGLGEADTIGLVSDLDNITATGFYRYGGSATNKPGTQAGVVTHITRFFDGGAMRHSQHAIDVEVNSWTRINDNGTWSDWEEIYHTGNLNQFELSATTANKYLIGSQFANAGVAYYVVPVMANGPPSGITVTGTFSLVTTLGFVAATGLTSSDITFVSESSNKSVIFEVADGAIGNTLYWLRNETANSKITINY